MRALRVICLLLLITRTSQARAACDDPPVAEVLAKVRAAVGITEASCPAFVMRGSARKFELPMSHRFVCDGHGRFRSTIDGPIGNEQGFDGEDAWTRDFSTATRRLQLYEREETQLSAWVRSGFWLCAGAPVIVTSLDEPTAGANEVLLKIATASSVTHGTLAIDRGSWLPKRLEFASVGDIETTYFEDYQPVSGIRLPFHIVSTQAGGVPAAITIEQADELQDAGASEFTFHPHLPIDARFDTAISARLEVKRTRSGHLLVRPRLGEEEVGWFLFDSGAGIMCVDTELAERLRLPTVGITQVKGAGGSTHSTFCRLPRLRVGPLVLTDCLAVELNLRPIGMALGEPVVGIVGYQMFQASVVELDMDSAKVSLYDPAKYMLPEHGRWFDLFILGNHPCCQARFEGDREGVFRLDSGGAGTVLFHTQAVDRFHLLEGRKTAVSMLGGVGGLMASRRGTLEWFELGGNRFDKPQVDFARAKKGAAQGNVVIGTIGHQLLKSFRIVLAYQEGKVAFLKRDN